MKFELDKGRLVTLMAPPGEIRVESVRTIVFLLKLTRNVPAWTGIRRSRRCAGRNPDRSSVPTLRLSPSVPLPSGHLPEGYLETIPELIVEVRSKNDSIAEMRSEGGMYLKAGVSIVW